MTEKEVKELTIFLSDSEAFIAKPLKSSKPGKARRPLTEMELMNFVVWFVKRNCKKLNTTEFDINVDGKPKYKFTVLPDEEQPEVSVNVVKAE